MEGDQTPQTEDRIVETCHSCGEGIDVPNKGMGRAVAAAWRTRHQHDA